MAALKPNFRKLDGPVTDDFDCGEESQNKFLLEQAWQSQSIGVSVTHLAYVKGMLAGYIALGMDGVDLTSDERPTGAIYARVSALKVYQFGVDKKFQFQGLGENLLDLGILHAQEMSETVGCRYLILDAVSDKVGYYEKRGWVINERGREKTEQQRKKTADPKLVTVGMRFDLRVPGDPPVLVINAPPRPRSVLARLASRFRR